MKKTYYAIKRGDRYKHFPDGNWNNELDARCLFVKKSTAEAKMDIIADEIVEIELIDKSKESKNGKWVCAPDLQTDIWRACDYFDTKEAAILAGKSAIKIYQETNETGDVEDILGFYPDDAEEIVSFAVGQCLTPSLPPFADNVIESAQEDVYDQCGESADAYLDDVSDLDKRELEKLIQGWFEKSNYLPTCYTIINVEQIFLEGETE